MRRHAAVPLAQDGSGRYLPWLIGLMVFLAAIATGIAFGIAGGLERWDSGLRGALTVELPPPDAGPLPAGRIEQVLALLRTTRGVASAVPIDPAESQRLIQPWLGEGLDPALLPLPVLVDVHVLGGIGVDMKALETGLAAIVPGATVARHAAWLDRLIRVAELIELSAAVIVALIGAACVLAVVFATRTGLSLHAAVVDLLHLMGASDAFIAAQFQWHAFRLGLRGGLIGLVMAFLAFGALKLAAEHGAVPEGSDLLPALRLPVEAWIAILLLPLATALTGLVTARVTVLRALARML